MARCEVCGKGLLFGNNVSHSMRHTRRRWRANIQRVRVIENGAEKRMHMCVQCIKTRVKTH